MSNTKEELLNRLGEALPKMTDDKMEYLTGFVDGVSAMCNKREAQGENVPVTKEHSRTV